MHTLDRSTLFLLTPAYPPPPEPQGFKYMYVADSRSRAAADRFCASALPGGRVAYATAANGSSLPTWPDYPWVMQLLDTYLSTNPFTGGFPPPLPPAAPAPPAGTTYPTITPRAGKDPIWVGVKANNLGVWASSYTTGERLGWLRGLRCSVLGGQVVSSESCPS